jgi:zinc transport system ATP-binding protein
MKRDRSIEPEYVLPDPLTLRLHRGHEVVFSSEKHWLHPLFELEEILLRTGNPGEMLVADRITGRAAAFLLTRLGIRNLRTGVLSQAAIPVLDRWGIEYRCEEIIEKVSCSTEALLSGIQDPENAYALVRERRERSRTGNRSGMSLPP